MLAHDRCAKFVDKERALASAAEQKGSMQRVAGVSSRGGATAHGMAAGPGAVFAAAVGQPL